MHMNREDLSIVISYGKYTFHTICHHLSYKDMVYQYKKVDTNR